MGTLLTSLNRQIPRLSTFTPTKQRFAIGAFGLFSQTAIDATNKDVDPKTREHSAVRTFVKTIITTIGGVGAREIGQTIGEKLVKNKTIDIPEKYLSEWKKGFQDILKQDLPAKSDDLLTSNKALKLIRQEFGKLVDKDLKEIPKKISFNDFATKKYGLAMGAACAIVVAAISVFAWDMPFTNKVMNFVMSKIDHKKDQENKKSA